MSIDAEVKLLRAIAKVQSAIIGMLWYYQASPVKVGEDDDKAMKGMIASLDALLARFAADEQEAQK